jgi:hypothetical protein
VVFLRDQQHATDADQVAFCRLFGEITKPHPTIAGDGVAILPIDSEQGRASSWHTGVTFVDRARRRLMHRTTIAGPVPVGIGGDRSVPRKGDASFYSSLAGA